MTDRPLAIVTGTSRGLGAAIAKALVDLEWEVHGLARGEPDDSIAAERTYVHHRCDLSETHAVKALCESEFAAILWERRRVGLVNNAGVLDLEPIVDCDIDHLVQSFVVNTAVPIWIIGWLLRFAPAEAALRIVDISSGAAETPYPGWAAYCASKAALDMAARVLAVEHEEVEAIEGRNLAIVEYAPGVVATRMQEQIRSASPSAFPRKQRFVQLHDDDQLVPPAAPAAEIAALLAADELPPFSRRRFGG